MVVRRPKSRHTGTTIRHPKINDNRFNLAPVLPRRIVEGKGIAVKKHAIARQASPSDGLLLQ